MGDWQVVETPAVQILRVERERYCQGRVFLLWRRCDDRWAFLSQSLPALVSWLNGLGSVKFHASSFYRCARRGRSPPRQGHHGWTASRWKTSELEELNNRLSQFERLAFLVKDPDRWVIGIESGATAPGS